MLLQVKARHFQNAQYQHMHNCPIYNALSEIIGPMFGVNTCQVIINSDTSYTFRKKGSVHYGYSEPAFKDDYKWAESRKFNDDTAVEIEILGMPERN